MKLYEDLRREFSMRIFQIFEIRSFK